MSKAAPESKEGPITTGAEAVSSTASADRVPGQARLATTEVGQATCGDGIAKGPPTIGLTASTPLVDVGVLQNDTATRKNMSAISLATDSHDNTQRDGAVPNKAPDSENSPEL